jgi:hypothetical protein
MKMKLAAGYGVRYDEILTLGERQVQGGVHVFVGLPRGTGDLIRKKEGIPKVEPPRIFVGGGQFTLLLRGSVVAPNIVRVVEEDLHGDESEAEGSTGSSSSDSDTSEEGAGVAGGRVREGGTTA